MRRTDSHGERGQTSKLYRRLGSKRVMLDLMIFEVKKLYPIPSPRVEPCTRATKLFGMSFLEKVTGKLPAK